MAKRQGIESGAAASPLDASQFAPRPRAERVPAEALHICPGCASDLVYPVEWAPAEERSWSVELRCPECEWIGGGVYAQDAVDRFDEVLDDGTQQVIEDLSLLARSNMQEQVERFIAALHADLVVPEDF